jgi:hypothetical protein
MLLACWYYSIEEQRPQTFLKIMGMMARLPCCLAAPGGSTLSKYGLGPYS